MTAKLSIIQRCIIKSYPEWDESRHYWTDGDVIEFNKDFVVLCTRSLGFKHDEFIVIKGFNKGNLVDIAIDNTPYLAKQDYHELDMTTLASKHCLKKPKLLYLTGDILTDEYERLMVITHIIDGGKGYYAFVLTDPNANAYSYKHTSIYMHNMYIDYIKK